MYLNGRWVPLETVNTVFALWAIAVVALGVIVFVFWRRRPPSKRDGKASRRRDKQRDGKRKQ